MLGVGTPTPTVRFDLVTRGDLIYRRRARATAADRGEHNLAKFNGGCRCARCRAARRRYDRERWWVTQLLVSGEVRRKVSPAHLADVLDQLTASGWTVEQIAEAAACSPATLWKARRAARDDTDQLVWSTVQDRVCALGRR